MRLRLATGLILLLAAAVAAALESAPSKRAIPNAPAAAALKKEDAVEGSGDPPRAGTVDTDTRKSSGYSPDDEDAVEGSGAPPLAPSGTGGPVPPAVVPGTGTGAQKPPQKPQPPSPPPADSDDESVEGSGGDQDSGSPFTPPSLTTTTTTTAAPSAASPPPSVGGVVPPTKTMWETVAITETPVLTTRGPIYEPPPRTTTTSSPKEKTTERIPTRPNTTEQPALFPFHDMLKPGIFAAVVGGTVVGLLMAILLVMFIVYRMRKRDEGSYALEEPKQRPYAGYAYTKASSTKEFYA